MAGASLWLRIVATVAAALAASWVSLLYRYRRKGRPFASRRSAGWALAVITVTMAAATGVGLGLPVLTAAVPPFTIGLLVPTLLCAARAGKPEPPAERPVWYEIASAGVTLLIDHLEQQMCADRDSWCEAQVREHWSLDQLEDAVWCVHAVLERRISGDRARRTRLRSDFDAACQAVRAADKASAASPREAGRARYTAEQALITMLGRAWDWGHTDISTA
jgi:uncharacterized membrane protein